MVSPVIVMGLAVPVAVTPPGLAVTVYAVIGLPPSLSGGVKLIVAPPLPADTFGASGGLGGVAARGVHAGVAVDGWLLPAALVATTVKV